MEARVLSFPIRDWAEDDKPREKLVNKGSSTLSDAELIAILIGSGSRNESAVALSKRILASVGHNLNELGRLSVNKLMQFKGIGEAKAVSIAAALEIGRRRRSESTTDKVSHIRASKDTFDLLYPLIGELPHEEFWVVYLNTSNKVLYKLQLSKGGITGTLVDVRLILKHALELGAVGLVLAHNHPSGSLRPSTSDKRITQRIKTAAEALDIKVLDHIIITQHCYMSFSDRELL